MMPRNLTLAWLLGYERNQSSPTQTKPQMPCPLRSTVLVNQECCGRFFHSQHPVRLRSWRRPCQLGSCRAYPLSVCWQCRNCRGKIWRSSKGSTQYVRCGFHLKSGSGVTGSGPLQERVINLFRKNISLRHNRLRKMR